jgi:hypothetical protein
VQVIKRLLEYKTAQVKDYIVENLLPVATPEQAKCARGRLNLWLEAEPVYSIKKYKSAHHDERIWQFIKRIYPQAALAQVYFATGNIGINWHRDASYAKPEAYILNLGKVCLESKSNQGKVTSLELTGGEIIRFNSKLLHRAIPREESRVGIGIWSDAIAIANPDNWIK